MIIWLRIVFFLRSYIFVGKGLVCFFVVVGVILVMMLIGVGLGMWFKNFFMLVVVLLCIVSCYVGIMMLFFVVGKMEEVVVGIVWGFNVFVVMFGGGMIFFVFMLSFMWLFSNISLVKWSILLFEGVIWWEFSWVEVVILLIVFFVVGGMGMGFGCWFLLWC